MSILLFTECCSYNNIPRQINKIDKNSLKQGFWVESNIEDNEERIILQYYKNGILNGDYRELFTDGVLAAKGKFKNGVPIGRWDFYLNTGVLIRWLIHDEKGNVLSVGTVNAIW